jgi:hypothetical protein
VTDPIEGCSIASADDRHYFSPLRLLSKLLMNSKTAARVVGMMTVPHITVRHVTGER